MSWKLQLSSLKLVGVRRVSWAWAPLGERGQKRAVCSSRRGGWKEDEEMVGRPYIGNMTSQVMGSRVTNSVWPPESPIRLSHLCDLKAPCGALGRPRCWSSSILQDKGTCGFRLCLRLEAELCFTNTMSQQQYMKNTHFLWLNSVWASYTLLWLTLNTFSNSTSQRLEYCKWSTQRTCEYTINSPNTTQDQCCRLMKLQFISLHIPKSVNMSTWRITTKHVPVFMLLQLCA